MKETLFTLAFRSNFYKNNINICKVNKSCSFDIYAFSVFCDGTCVSCVSSVCIEYYQGHVEMYGGHIDNNTLSLLTLSRLPLSVSRHKSGTAGGTYLSCCYNLIKE